MLKSKSSKGKIMSLDKINNASPDKGFDIFESCCCAPNWIKKMIQATPFVDKAALLAASEKAFSELNEQDYLIAFQGHPQIGDLNTLHKKYANTSGTASNEQAGMSVAESTVLEEMVALNKAYLDKFGFIFIVCASGKSAVEMLALIKARIGNDRATEVKIAGQEQAKITAIRLEKLL